MEGGEHDGRNVKLRGRKLQGEESRRMRRKRRERKKKNNQKGQAAARQAHGKRRKRVVHREEEKVGTGGTGPGSQRRKGAETAVHRGGAKEGLKEGGLNGWSGGIMRVAERRVLTT